MDNEVITQNEVENDGKTIHLYFDRQIGLYVAYGFSAFFVSHIVNAVFSFSEELEMPVALMRKEKVTELRLSTVKHRHDYHEYYRLELKRPIRLDGYVAWGKSLKWK
ncbi:MAG: hypothetical protein J5871_04040 [Bacteroidales bacterium]|nr:hypothetical protein [Bacteroidales bacterium]